MEFNAQNRLEHSASFFLSVLLNGLLVLAMLHFINIEPSRDREVTTVMVIEEEEYVEIDDPIEDFVEEPVEMEDFTDVDMPTYESEIDTDFDVEVEPVETPEQTDVNQLTELLSDVPSVVQMSGLMPGRTTAGRQEAMRTHGGSEETEAAVRLALEWLKNNQQEDGSWRGQGNADSRTGMTGLAILTFLAHGETPGSAQYGATVRRGLQFLVDDAQQDDGSFRYADTRASRGGVYAQGIATYALSEAYAMTQNPLILEPMKKGIRRIITGQRPDGGFDYGYARNGGERDRCTSVAGWQIQAMKAAFMTGVEIPELREALENAADGMKLNQRDDNNKFIYSSKRTHREIDEQYNMTAIGVLSLQILGEGHSQTARNAMRTISTVSPEEYHNEMEPVYAWYYATQAYFHEGDRTWERWNRQFAPMAVDNQNEDGSWTWDLGRTGGYGPVYHTTFTALSLMVYYRYLPTMQTELIQPQTPPSRPDDDDDPIRIQL